MTAPGRAAQRTACETRPAEAAAALRRRGLAAPARLLVDAHRPYLPLVHDAATFLSPLLRLLKGSRAAAGADDALTPGAVDRFLEHLERPAPQNDPECQTSER